MSKLPTEVGEQMRDALNEAHRDISEWLQLAKRQRADIPDANHCPYAPTTYGISASECVLHNIGLAIRRYRESITDPLTPPAA